MRITDNKLLKTIINRLVIRTIDLKKVLLAYVLWFYSNEELVTNSLQWGLRGMW